VVILEEAAYISLETFLEVVAPILVLEHACIIGISTMGKEPTNFFTKLLKNELFYSYKISYVCDACLAKGLQRSCKHRLDSIPHWSNESKLELIKNIVGEEENERFERENLGVVAEESSPYCFSASKIQEFMSNPRQELTLPARFVYVCIDPCAGSDIKDERTSDFAVVTISGPGVTILGMEAIDVFEPEHYNKRLIEHLQRIRRLRYCEACIFVLDVESGTGLEVGHITKLIQDNFKDVLCLRDFHRKPGTRTHEAEKKDMYERTKIAIDSGDIRIHKDFVCTDPHPETILAKFQTQMCAYERRVVVGKGLFHQNKELYSGKGANGTKLDDLSVTLQRAIRARHVFLYSGKYNHWHSV
jgi:hypothetical protein